MKLTDVKEPEWTAQNMNRKQGDTTFDICGWCEYVGCGACRYGCHLDSDCDLMKDYGDLRKVQWNTKCRVKLLGKLDILDIIDSKKSGISNLQRQIKDTEIEIKVLTSLSSKAEDSPILPDNRNADHYPLNSIVYVFYKNQWNKGTVVSGYRTGDGCVSYVLDDYPNSKKGWGCGISVPCIISEKEYNYFKNNHDKYLWWLQQSDRTYNGDKLDMSAYYKSITGKNYVKLR